MSIRVNHNGVYSLKIIKNSTFISTLAALVFISCSGPVIRRDREAYHPTARRNFNVVKKRVALLAIFNEAPYGGDDLGIIATEELRMELSKTGDFVIDPMGSKMFGSSKEIYAGGGSKLVQLSRQAKISGVNFVLFGRITDARIREKNDEIGLVRKSQSYTESKIELRIFDVNSGKEIYTDTIKGNADDSTFRFFVRDAEENLNYRRDLLRYGIKVAVRKAIPQILDVSAKLDWIGRVAKIAGNKIYVNAGRQSGINVTDILRVITEGQEIFDPETGALLGVSKGEIKGTLEVIDYFGEDGAIAVLHSGGSVVEGDYVMLY